MFLNKIVIVLFFFVNTFLFSQSNALKKDSIQQEGLDEVIVTATRTARQLSLIPMPVTLVSKKQIKETGSVRLRDILLEQTGMTVVTDVGNSEGLQLQGMDAEYTLLMIDGVPLIGRTVGNIDLNRVTVNNIKQIEIVKGPSSSLYGSEALGGVVNIITEKPVKKQVKGEVTYMTRYGAKEEQDINGNFVYKKGKLGIVSGINLNLGDGFDLSPDTSSKTSYPYQNGTGNLLVTYAFSDKIKVDLSQRYFKENFDNIEGKGTIDEYNGNIKVSQTLRPNFTIDYTFYGTSYKTESIFNGLSSVFNQTLVRPEIRTQFPIKKGTFIAGVGGNFDALQRTFFDDKKQYNSEYIFGQYDFNLLKNLNVVLGARFDKYYKFKSAFSPKFSARYDFNDVLAIKGSVGFGYKVPDFRQLFFNFRNITSGYIVLGTQTIYELYGYLPEVQRLSKNLQPESSIGYNIGFELKPTSNLIFTVNFFRNDIQNLINYFDTKVKDENLPNTRIFSYENINEVYTQGIELDINYRINKNFKFIGGYQFLDTGDKKKEKKIKSKGLFIRDEVTKISEQLSISDYVGLANRSQLMINSRLFYENHAANFSANIRAIFRSKYAPFDTNSNGIIDRYDDFIASRTQINTAVSKKFFNMMTVLFGVDNLFNEQGRKNTSVFPNNDTVLRLGRTFYGRIQFEI